MKKIRWLVINGLFTTALYFGFIEQIEGARNVALIYAWFCIIVSLATLIDSVAVAVSKDVTTLKSVPSCVNDCFDFLTVGFFAWFGCWFVAVFFLIHIFLIKVFVEKVKKLKEKPNQ